MSFFKLIIAAALAATLSLTGCGSDNSDTPASSGGGGVVDNSSIQSITLSSPSVSVSTAGETKQITVTAFSGDGTYTGAGSISVLYPSEITEGNVSGGSFASDVVNIINGQALFTFTAPDPLTYTGSLDFTFMFTGRPDINATLTIEYTPNIPKLVIQDTNITITKNGEVANIDVMVYNQDNAPYQTGNVKVEYPNDVLNGVDVGTFAQQQVAVVNGKASFVYTAPNPLDGNASYVFKFYHEDQPALSKKPVTINIIPEAAQIAIKDYKINGVVETKMALESSQTVTFFVEDSDGIKLEDAQINFIRVTNANPAIATIQDSAGNINTTLEVNASNNFQMFIETNTRSGIVPLEVEASFKDINGNDKNLTKSYSFIVLSGPPTAMSLEYAGTSNDGTNAKFVENWVLTVTDKYNNLVNTNPVVSSGMITGYATTSGTSTNAGNYLFYTGTGSIATGTPDVFSTFSGTVFNNVDLVNDRLAVFGGTGYIFDTYGKWDIDNVQAGNVLALADDFNGTATNGLSFAVGHNFRNATCSGNPKVANVYPKDGVYTIDQNGHMILQVEYDYYLTGKSTVLWANLVGSTGGVERKLGIARKITLRGLGLSGGSYSFSQGFTGVVRLDVSISDTVEYYKNANFAYNVTVTGDGVTWQVVGSSMADGDITNCALNGGVGYVDVNITNAPNAGSVSLTDVVVTPEF